MSDAVQAVIRKGEGQESFSQDLREDGKSTETGGHGGALEVPAEQGGDEVCGTVGVDGDGEGGAGDSVERGHVPCYLGAVDGEMGGDGAVFALFGEDFTAGGLGDAGCCCLSG